MTHIEIPDTVTNIGSEAFRYCTGLQSVKIPESVTEINSGTFYGCSALKDLSWVPYRVAEIRDSAFRNCTGLQSVELTDLTTRLGSYAFADCSELRSFTAGAGLVSIYSNAFQDCAKLTEVDLNDGLTSIGDYAFQNCTSLPEIVLSDSVSSIGAYCFQSDRALASVTLSNNLTEIPFYAFSACPVLADVVIPKGVKTIGDIAFKQDAMLQTITIPATVTSIGNTAFSDPAAITVRGVAGSYAETCAGWKKFVDITVHITDISLANGTDALTIGYETVAPPLVCVPAGNTDTITLMSDDPSVVSVVNGTLLKGERTGTARIAATASGGQMYTFTVTISSMTGIEIAKQPDKVIFMVGDKKDLSGLVVNAVFSNGTKEQIYDYTVSGFTTDVCGTFTVDVSYGYRSASFPIIVTAEQFVMGTLGGDQELTWTLFKESGSLAVIGPIGAGEVIYVTSYGKDGRMLAVKAVTASAQNVEVGYGFDSLALFWTGADSGPKCPCVYIED